MRAEGRPLLAIPADAATTTEEEAANRLVPGLAEFDHLAAAMAREATTIL